MAFATTAGRELAAQLAEFEPDIVVSVATMGIPLAIEVTRSLGLDDYVILHKTPKIHLGESFAEPVRSITTDSPQKLRIDPARVPAVRGKRVAVVDDIISTGASTLSATEPPPSGRREPAVIGALMTEGSAWRTTLGADAEKIHALGAMPVFRPDPSGDGLVEDWADPRDAGGAIWFQFCEVSRR